MIMETCLKLESISGAGWLSRSGRSLNRSGLGRNSIADLLRHDHALTAAVAVGAAAGNHFAATAVAAIRDDFAAAAAIRGDFATAAAIRGSLTARSTLSHSLFAVAAILAMTEQAMALLAAVATMVTGEQPAMALTSMAAMPSNRTGVTANEGDGHQREEHCKRKTEKPLHQKPPTRGNTNAAAASTKPSRLEPRSGTATGPQQPMFHAPPPARLSSACEFTQTGKSLPTAVFRLQGYHDAPQCQETWANWGRNTDFANFANTVPKTGF